MSREGACAHEHVRCAVARVRVRAKSILKSVRDVRACGSFLGVRCATIFFHTFGTKFQPCEILEKVELKLKQKLRPKNLTPVDIGPDRPVSVPNRWQRLFHKMGMIENVFRFYW